MPHHKFSRQGDWQQNVYLWGNNINLHILLWALSQGTTSRTPPLSVLIPLSGKMRDVLNRLRKIMKFFSDFHLSWKINRKLGWWRPFFVTGPLFLIRFKPFKNLVLWLCSDSHSTRNVKWEIDMSLCTVLQLSFITPNKISSVISFFLIALDINVGCPVHSDQSGISTSPNMLRVPQEPEVSHNTSCSRLNSLVQRVRIVQKKSLFLMGDKISLLKPTSNKSWQNICL